MFLAKVHFVRFQGRCMEFRRYVEPHCFITNTCFPAFAKSAEPSGIIQKGMRSLHQQDPKLLSLLMAVAPKHVLKAHLGKWSQRLKPVPQLLNEPHPHVSP